MRMLTRDNILCKCEPPFHTGFGRTYKIYTLPFYTKHKHRDEPLHNIGKWYCRIQGIELDLHAGGRNPSLI